MNLTFTGNATISWKDVTELVTFLLAVWRAIVALRKNKAELKWQSEFMLKANTHTIPPMRHKLMTLDDPWEDVISEANKLKIPPAKLPSFPP